MADPPISLKKQKEKEEMERRRKFLTIEDIVADSQSNQKIIYKFMKKGFKSLSVEELAATLVNPSWAADFEKNAKEDWVRNYGHLVTDKIQKSPL